MYRTILISFALIISMLFMPQSAMAAKTKTVTLDVPGMTCKFCPITIRKALRQVPGVLEAKSDYDSKTATVTFDPDKTSVEDLTKATENAGYKSSLKKQDK